MNNKNIQTLNDLIRYGKTSSFSLPLVSLVTKGEDVIYLDELAYSKYRNLLLEKSIVVTLNTTEYNKYRFNPKELSTDLYGTPNLYHLILWLNDTSEFEFDKHTLRLIPVSTINSLFKSILVHEEASINKSKNKLRG